MSTTDPDINFTVDSRERTEDFEATMADYAKRHPEDAAKLRDVLRVANGGGTVVECREHSGLSMGQASKLSGIPKPRLESIEQGAATTDMETEKLRGIYGVPGWVTTTPKTLVIYHAKCPDGLAAAWAAYTIFGVEATYHPASYGEAPPPVDGMNVLIVDFSYPRDVLLRMCASARAIQVFDHHKTAEENLRGLPFCTFDANRSGAGLTWDLLRPETPRPWLIDYTEDRDLWRHALPHTHAVNAWLRAQPRTMEGYDAASRVELEVARAAGEVILAEERVYIEGVKARASIAELHGHHVPVVACGRHCASEIVGELSVGHPFAASWQERDGAVHYELRSREGGLDVSEVARAFGGGGHKHAAGFSAPSIVHQDPDLP